MPLHNHRTHRDRFRTALILVMACIAVACLCSCRPTDFFVEVVISPFADTVDENNEDQTIVNSPDATDTSDDLASLAWNSKSKKSDQVENLVTYSKTPTSTLNTHHSNYDPNPRFKGIKSSDPVYLDFGKSSKLQKKKGTTSNSPEDSTEQTENKGTQSDTTGNNTKNNGAGGDNDTKKNNDTDGDGDDTSKKEDKGYGDKVTVYDPDNALADPPKADHVAAIGQAAVLVQSIGGKGALTAMDKQTYSTKQSKGAASFSEVFSDELASGFSSKCLLWSGDGTSSDSLSSVSALVEACGKGGVIIYDQNQVNPNGNWFSKKQREALVEAKITFVPVSFTSVRGMKDAAIVVGKVLSKSSAASAYNKAIDEVMNAASAAVADSSGKVSCAIATDFVTGLTYTGGVLKTSSGLLFTRIDDEELLSTWTSNAGIDLRGSGTTGSVDNDYDALWGMVHDAPYNKKYFSKSAYSDAKELQLRSEYATSSSIAWTGYGLGSSRFPYLIVSASGNLTAAQVKDRMVSSIESYATNGSITAYSALPGNAADVGSAGIRTTIGSDGLRSGVNLFVDDAGNATGAAERSVRANPSGLLGSWTEGSVESVLETAWIARIFSGDVDNGGGYEPVCSLSTADFKQAVLDFYQTAYRYDASGVYSKVVIDEGLD